MERRVGERDESFPGSFWLSRESLEVREESFHAVRDKPITRCKNWLQVKQNASSLIIPSNMIQLLLCALINILISSTWKASALPRAFRLILLRRKWIALENYLLRINTWWFMSENDVGDDSLITPRTGSDETRNFPLFVILFFCCLSPHPLCGSVI